MPFFRRKESLHERLAREGGLVAQEPGDEPLDPRPPTLETGIHGVQRPRDWDVTLTTDAEGIDGDEARFVALPDRTLLVEQGPDTSLEALAAAVEAELPVPYRARAVQARRIEVLRLRDAPDGDALDVTRTGDETELRVDGEPEFGSVPQLEERGEREGREFAVHAERLDGDLWEVRASAL